MNRSLEKLCKLASKKERIILGLMSGTSLDGLDLALCRITGFGRQTGIDLLHFETVNYRPAFKEDLKSIFSKKQADLEKLVVLNEWVGIQYAAIINSCLKKWKLKSNDIDVIASHGQTIYHAPKSLHKHKKYTNATLQIGDGDHIAVHTGIITISDFRQKHLAAGGEGAPLAVYGDYLLFSKQGENRIMLNIGGIANFTFLPGDAERSRIFTTDTGPGNTIMDAFVQSRFSGTYFDRDGERARKGKLSNKLLQELKKHAFFKMNFPKTTGPELFNLEYLNQAMDRSGTRDLTPEDILATLNRFTADMIIEAIKVSGVPQHQLSVYCSGGGIHNPVLMENIRSQLPDISFQFTDSLHIRPDAKEAVLFALLANECINGSRPGMGKGKNKIPPVTLGKISFPD